MLRTGELLAFFPEQPEARGHGWSASMLRGDRTPAWLSATLRRSGGHPLTARAMTVAGLAALMILQGAILAPRAMADDGPPGAAETQVVPAGIGIRVRGPAVSLYEVHVEVTGDAGLPLIPGQPASLLVEERGHKGGTPDRSFVLVDVDGVARFRVGIWKEARLTAAYAGFTTSLRVRVSPSRRAVEAPRGAPRPRTRFTDPAGVGTGPNPNVKAIDAERRRQMTGRSWRPGCTPFSSLREVSVNYWGTDGYRYRGTLIVRSHVASRVAKAFSRLYATGYRFHSIHPVDMYGRSPRGVGANDYASMAAGNTSAFNCRYIVGQESSHAWSPHASGTALDINPWENPYVARGGTYPNTWWLSRSRRSPLVLSWGSPAVSILRDAGWVWGGRYRDFHHFDFAGW